MIKSTNNLQKQTLDLLDKDQKLKKQLLKYFKSVNRYTPQFKDYPAQYFQQRILYSILILRKHRKYKQNKIQIQALQKKFFDLSDQIQKKSSNKLSKEQTIDLSKKVLQYITYYQNINSLNKREDQYLTFMVRAVCQKQKSFFSVFQSSFQYSKKDYLKFGQYFDQKINYLNFDDRPIKQAFFSKFEYSNDIAYIMKHNAIYYYLDNNEESRQSNNSQQNNHNKVNDINVKQSYFNEKNINNGVSPNQHLNNNNNLKVTNQKIQSNRTIPSVIDASEQDPHKLQFIQSKYCKFANLKDYFPQQYQVSKWNSNNSNVNFIGPKTVQCSICHLKKSQFSCLTYNYGNYCDTCLINPKVKTSNIPSNLIEKYLKDNGMDTRRININCSQCQALMVLNGYDAGNKPKAIKCGVCEKRVCLTHDCVVQECFCYCLTCNTSTFSIPTLNLNLCQDCGLKYCLKCGMKSKKFCGCICKNCLGLQKQGHQCIKKCHRCTNHLRSLRTCSQCTLPICSGCYYFGLENANGNPQKIRCQFADFS